MNIRPKTVRRLLILFVAFASVTGAIVALVMLRLHQRQQQTAKLREQAHAAFVARDYDQALALYSQYLARNHESQENEPDAVYEYARSRKTVPMDGSRHFYEAIGIYERYLQLDPTDPHDAQHELLELYTQVRYNKEARGLAARLLKKDPGDIVALWAQVESLTNDRNFADALTACQKLNRIDPLNFVQQQCELDLMRALKQPPEQIVDHARRLLEAHPDDPRFVALMSVAYTCAHDDENAKKWIEQAAQLPPADIDSVLRIIEILDANQQFDLSDNLLDRSMRKSKDPRLLRKTMQRLWEREDSKQIVDRLAQLDAGSPASDAALLGYRALALRETGHPDQALRIVAALGTRHDDTSKAWVIALQAEGGPGKVDSIRKLREAEARDPVNPVFPFLLGKAYLSLGETEEAIRALGEAGRLSPSWAVPYCMMSELLAGTGRYPAAMQTADEARRRAPNLALVQITYACAWYALDVIAGKDAQPQNLDRLLSLVEGIQQARPNEPTTLPIYVSLLARRGHREQAVQVLKDSMSSRPAPSAQALARLTAVSEQEHLGLEQQIIACAEQAYGTTPALALTRAMLLHRAGRTADGVHLIDSLRQAHPADISWQVVEAQYRDATGDAAALRQWIALGDEHPSDLQLQYTILASSSRLTDRAFWRRTIDRVKAMTGPESQLWQIEEARWQLSGNPSGTELDATISAIQKLTQDWPALPEPHRMLADALLRTTRPDRMATATAELTAAYELLPGDFDSASQLAQSLISQGRAEKAAELVDAVAREPRLDREQRLWAAKTYAQLGQVRRAIQLLAPAPADARQDTARDALLASLYRRLGSLDEAVALYKQVLSRPDAPVGALADGAEFFVSLNQPDTAERFLARLDKMPLKPGTMQVLRAHFDELGGAPERARQALLDATDSNPQSEQLWQELAGWYLRRGQYDQADSSAARGLKAIPGSAVLATLREQIGRLRHIPPLGLEAIIDVISHDPQNEPASHALRVLSEAWARHDSPIATAAALRQLADQYLSFLPLQSLAVQRELALGRYDDAIALAARATQAAPGAPEPYRLLCSADSSAGRWDDARQAAIRWRQASAADTLDPDLFIATTYLQQARPDPQAALRQLAAYVAESSPSAKRDLALPLYCQALIAAGRADDAAALLQPRLSEPSWRTVWMRVAAFNNDADAASQWIRRISVPSDPTEQLRLAQAWDQVGTRFDSQPAHDSARDVLKQLIVRQQMGSEAWATWALVNQSLDALSEAETGWREYLKLRPDDPHARNNLAYVLLREGGNAKLAEAGKLVRQAIDALPAVSTFYDTLARVQLQSGKTDDAVKSFHTALDTDQTNLEAMIGLADVLQSRRDGRDEAKSLLTRINAAVSSGASLPPAVRKQFERVKGALSSSL